MSPASLENVENIRKVKDAKPRIGLTELSRSKSWQKQMTEYAVVELTDRNETAGWLVSPEGMESLLDRIDELEQELERLEVDSLITSRRGHGDFVGGRELAGAAKGLLGERLASMAEVVNAG